MTRAAVRSGVSSASRSRRAAAVAASSSLSAVTIESPCRPRSTTFSDWCSWSSLMTCSQSFVWSAGRSASLITRPRAYPARSSVLDTGQTETDSRSVTASSSRFFRAPCGCCGSTSAQASGANSASSPGKTTQPCGAWAIATSRPRVAGAVPVEPAAMTACCGGRSHQASASRFRRATRRAPTSTTPRSASRSGQRSSALCRNRRLNCQCSARSASTRSPRRSAASTSSICRLSRKPPRASPNSRAAAAVGSPRFGSVGQSSATSRVSSNRRRRGSIAAGRSRARSPGSKGGSPASRSPRGRICGGRTARPPVARTKASASARAPRRVGVRTRACESASGPCGPSAS